MDDRNHKFGPIPITVGNVIVLVNGCTKCGLTFDQLFSIFEADFNLNISKIFFKCEDVDRLTKDEIVKIFNDTYPCKLTDDESEIKDIIE